jgi:hypothetical protein
MLVLTSTKHPQMRAMERVILAQQSPVDSAALKALKRGD